MAQTLEQKISAFIDLGNALPAIPDYITDNLNPYFELRPYQSEAFERFLYYLGNERLCQKPSQILFHMATGSGKTLIMAGAILHLYSKGYRNFLFFVNSDNIINKTRDNFLNQNSRKYLFSETISFGVQKPIIKEVDNFQSTFDDCINIVFSYAILIKILTFHLLLYTGHYMAHIVFDTSRGFAPLADRVNDWRNKWNILEEIRLSLSL